jgi:CheY-like chemotaxis protein
LHVPPDLDPTEPALSEGDDAHDGFTVSPSEPLSRLRRMTRRSAALQLRGNYANTNTFFQHYFLDMNYRYKENVISKFLHNGELGCGEGDRGSCGTFRDNAAWSRSRNVTGGREMQERRRILIVEDEYVIATLLANILEEAGWQVVGPVGYLAEALDMAASEDLDAALLDVNLGEQAVYPVAEVLDARNVPFVFVTGCSAEMLLRPYSERPRLGKPFKPAELVGTVACLIPTTAEAL